MVKATLKRVKEIFRPEVKEQKEDRPTLKRRLLLVVKLSDNTYILQGEQQIHQRNHCFRTEAINVFRTAFTFVLRDEVSTGKVFQHEYIQWHPIIFDLSFYLDSTLLEDADLTGLQCQLIKDHPFCEQLKEYHRSK